MEVDGSAADSGSGAEIVMTSPEGNSFQYAIKFGFPASNNEAEYEAAIAGLRMCLAASAKQVLLKTDSQLVSGQLKGDFEVRGANMMKYVEKDKELIAQLQHFEVQADALSKLASSNSFNVEKTVTIDMQKEKSILEQIVTVNTVNQQVEWFSELVAYKLTGTLPNNSSAKKLRRQANYFIIYQDELYKKSFSLPLLKCATAWESKKILEEIHEGICGNHIGRKALALKALRMDFIGQLCWQMLRATSRNVINAKDILPSSTDQLMICNP